MLFAEDASETVRLSYDRPAYLEARHGSPAELTPLIAGVEGLAKIAAGWRSPVSE